MKSQIARLHTAEANNTRAIKGIIPGLSSVFTVRLQARFPTANRTPLNAAPSFAR